jgi:hypothetical protein
MSGGADCHPWYSDVGQSNCALIFETNNSVDEFGRSVADLALTEAMVR